MAEERLPWFPCYPSKLLGALAGMEADEQLVYLTTILRIYEVRGPIADDDRALARRTDLTPRRVTEAIVRLCRNGKLVRLPDGTLMNPIAQEEIGAQNGRVDLASEHGRTAATKGWQKRKQKQQKDDARALSEHRDSNAPAEPEHVHIHKHIHTPLASLGGEARADALAPHVQPVADEPRPEPEHAHEPEPQPNPQAHNALVVAEQPQLIPASKAGKATRGTRLPKDWILDQAGWEAARAEGLPDEVIRREADKFRDYWLAKSGSQATKTDWAATWRNWVRRAADDFNRRGPNGRPPSPHRRPAQQGLDAVREAFDRGYVLPDKPL